MPSFHNTHVQNTLTPFYLEQNHALGLTPSVRGRMVKLKSAVRDIIARHDYPHAVNVVLAELVTLGAVLSNMFKCDGKFKLQVQGGEHAQVSFMIADIYADGGVRACAHIKKDAVITQEVLSLQDMFGKGCLAFTIENDDAQKGYQGIVELQGTSLCDSMRHYFNQSEQIQTCFYFTLTQDFQTACIMLQKLPDDDKAAQDGDHAANDQSTLWEDASSFLATLTQAEAIELSPEDVLYKLFWEGNITTGVTTELAFHCPCSKSRIHRVLESLSEDEKQSIATDGAIKVSCDFCAKTYTFPVTRH